jgi:hypothetical protein
MNLKLNLFDFNPTIIDILYLETMLTRKLMTIGNPSPEQYLTSKLKVGGWHVESYRPLIVLYVFASKRKVDVHDVIGHVL